MVWEPCSHKCRSTSNKQLYLFVQILFPLRGERISNLIDCRGNFSSLLGSTWRTLRNDSADLGKTKTRWEWLEGATRVGHREPWAYGLDKPPAYVTGEAELENAIFSIHDKCAEDIMKETAKFLKSKYDVLKKTCARNQITVNSAIEEEHQDVTESAVVKQQAKDAINHVVERDVHHEMKALNEKSEKRIANKVKRADVLDPCSAVVRIRSLTPHPRAQAPFQEAASQPRGGRPLGSPKPKGVPSLPTTGWTRPRSVRRPESIEKMNSCSSDRIKTFNRFSAFVFLSTDCEIEVSPLNQKSKRNDITSNGNEKNNLAVNLSYKTLSNNELSVLEKGLKFCPTQKRVNEGDVRKELDTFHNKLRTIQFFEKAPQTTIPPRETINIGGLPFSNTTCLRKIKEKSNWRAPSGSPALEIFISLNEINTSKIPAQKIKNQNITENERQAIKTLSRDRSLTIKPADKGGAIVIQNTVDYVNEAHRQLNDTQTYVKTQKDLTEKHHQEVTQLIDEMVENKEITTKVAGILRVKQVRTPHIYFLPKIHKLTRPPPGRPIVSANSCATEKISSFVDIFLNPLTKKADSYIKDTKDFVTRIENLKGFNNPIIGTLDVTSLYTNIPNTEGLSSVEKILKKERPEQENPKNTTLLKLLDNVLKRNNFQFNGQHYLQIGGTAMGTKVAPAYANLFMRDLEETLLENHEHKPTVWWRYIDDIFFIWEHGENNLKKWTKYFNSAHQTIKFTEEFSHTEIPFLDTKVKVDHTGKLYTDLYSKPTDSHSYLRYDSAHPKMCKESLPYGQFLRVRRICTQKSDFKKHAKEMKNYFLDRGYPEGPLDKNIKTCMQTDRKN